MNADPDPNVEDADHRAAAAFVAARRQAQALPDYPGALPVDLGQAYGRQDLAIGMWADRVAGWKVGKIPQAWAARLGEERLVGPIFARHVQWVQSELSAPIAVIDGGFAAVEAEYIFVLDRDAPAAKLAWTPEEAADWVRELRLGIEFAGSPLASINVLGPAVVVSDFGNNAGLIVGPAVSDWRSRSWHELSCETYVGNQMAGRGGAASLSGGPLAALAFALARCAQRKRPLRAGDLISTGASTGIHDIHIGETARVEFAGGVVLNCHAKRAVAADSDSA